MITLLFALITTITWSDFYSNVATTGVTYRATLKALEGQRVRLRGYAVLEPPIPGGLLLTRMPYQDPHEVEETDIPFDAVAVRWRQGIKPPPIPTRPTIEGVLRLGNCDAGPVIVTVTLDDATPVIPQGATQPKH